MTIFGVQYGFFRLVIVTGAALLIGLFLWWLIKRTRFGLIVRAGVDDREMVSAMGIDVDRVFAGMFLVGSVLAGTAGLACFVPASRITLDPTESLRRQ